MNYIYEEQQECKMARKMANVPSCTKSDFTFGAYSHRHTCIHTLLQIGRERARGGWLRERELSTDTHSQKYRTDSDRRRKIMNLNINLKYLFYTNEIQRFFFAPFYRLLFFLSAFTFSFIWCFFARCCKNCMWNEKFDLPRESSIQLRSSTCFRSFYPFSWVLFSALCEL